MTFWPARRKMSLEARPADCPGDRPIDDREIELIDHERLAGKPLPVSAGQPVGESFT